MNHKEIKSIIDEVGKSYFNEKYEGLFKSSISNNEKARYSLKVHTHFLNEPEEIRNSNLKVRIYTQNFKVGNDCKEIGITGRFVFDKIKSSQLLSKNIYLLQSTNDGSLKDRNIIDQMNCPVSYKFEINPPHYVTVLNLRDLPQNERANALKDFVAAYFEWVANPSFINA